MIFFLGDKTSAPDVFSSCSFIPRANLETILVMVSYYGCDQLLWLGDMTSEVAGGQANFSVKMHVFSTFFNKKNNLLMK